MQENYKLTSKNNMGKSIFVFFIVGGFLGAEHVETPQAKPFLEHVHKEVSKEFFERVEEGKKFKNPSQESLENPALYQDIVEEKMKLDLLSKHLEDLSKKAPESLKDTYSQYKAEIDQKRKAYENIFADQPTELSVWRKDTIKNYESDLKRLTGQINEIYEPFLSQPSETWYEKYTLELNRLGKQLQLKFQETFNFPGARETAADLAKIFNRLGALDQAVSHQLKSVRLSKGEAFKATDLKEKEQLYQEAQEKLLKALIYYEKIPNKTKEAKDQVVLALRNIYQLAIAHVSDILALQKNDGMFADRMNKGEFGIHEIFNDLKNYVKILKAMGYENKLIKGFIEKLNFDGLKKRHEYGDTPTFVRSGETLEYDLRWYKTPEAYINDKLNLEFPGLNLEAAATKVYKAGEVIIPEEATPFMSPEMREMIQRKIKPKAL